MQPIMVFANTPVRHASAVNGHNVMVASDVGPRGSLADQLLLYLGATAGRKRMLPGGMTILVVSLICIFADTRIKPDLAKVFALFIAEIAKADAAFFTRETATAVVIAFAIPRLADVRRFESEFRH